MCGARASPSPPPHPGDSLRRAARRAPFAIDWYQGTACRPPPRAGAHQAIRRMPPLDRPGTPAGRSGQSETSPPEVTVGHDAIGDVASRSTTDQNLRADLRRAVETPHIEIRPARFAKIAVARPAAPAPMMIAVTWSVVGGAWLVCTFTVHGSQFTLGIGSWDLGVESREYPRCSAVVSNPEQRTTTNHQPRSTNRASRATSSAASPPSSRWRTSSS